VRHGSKRIASITVEIHDQQGALIADALVTYKLPDEARYSPRFARPPRATAQLCAALPLARYDSRFSLTLARRSSSPAARSIVVLGKRGGDFWAAFKQHAARNPRWLERENPLDDSHADVVERESRRRSAMPRSATHCASIHCTADARSTSSSWARQQGSRARASSVSWCIRSSVRGSRFVRRCCWTLMLDAPGDALGFDPCPGCVPRSCISACPVGAVSSPPDGRCRNA